MAVGVIERVVVGPSEIVRCEIVGDDERLSSDVCDDVSVGFSIELLALGVGVAVAIPVAEPPDHVFEPVGDLERDRVGGITFVYVVECTCSESDRVALGTERDFESSSVGVRSLIDNVLVLLDDKAEGDARSVAVGEGTLERDRVFDSSNESVELVDLVLVSVCQHCGA